MAPNTFCKDCVAEWGVPLTAARQRRRAPHPGPRCATHHRAFVKRSKLAAHDTRVARVYGLAPGEYERLLELQGGRCALCHRATGRTKRLAVDHDHKCCPGPTSCGACVRGLLCGPCNKLLGHGRDDPEFFYRVAAYLLRADRRREVT